MRIFLHYARNTIYREMASDYNNNNNNNNHTCYFPNMTFRSTSFKTPYTFERPARRASIGNASFVDYLPACQICINVTQMLRRIFSQREESAPAHRFTPRDRVPRYRRSPAISRERKRERGGEGGRSRRVEGRAIIRGSLETRARARTRCGVYPSRICEGKLRSLRNIMSGCNRHDAARISSSRRAARYGRRAENCRVALAASLPILLHI